MSISQKRLVFFYSLKGSNEVWQAGLRICIDSRTENAVYDHRRSIVEYSSSSPRKSSLNTSRESCTD